jgi:hypothetical protein
VQAESAVDKYFDRYFDDIDDISSLDIATTLTEEHASGDRTKAKKDLFRDPFHPALPSYSGDSPAIKVMCQ